MPADIADEALDFLLARAGLDLSAAQKAELTHTVALGRGKLIWFAGEWFSC